jgi:Raf kinase inhibitor-like YbhB/YbcL family protein
MPGLTETNRRESRRNQPCSWQPSFPLSLLLCALVLTQLQFAGGSDSSLRAKQGRSGVLSRQPADPGGGPPPGLALKSSAFESGRDIPAQFSCQGANVSPALSWTGSPSKTKSFVLIVDDPDAPSGTWVHWVVYDFPATVQSLSEGIPKQEALPGGGSQGVNDFHNIGYGGPCPPPGKPHRYFFKLYALDAKTNLKPGATKKEVEDAMKGHILSQAELVGRFGR